MSTLEKDVSRGIAAANHAKELADKAFIEFSAACEAFEWAKAEDARARVVGHMEAVMDNIAAAYKRLEVER